MDILRDTFLSGAILDSKGYYKGKKGYYKGYYRIRVTIRDTMQ